MDFKEISEEDKSLEFFLKIYPMLEFRLMNLMKVRIEDSSDVVNWGLIQ
jgi:hypothetical protein